MILQPLIFFFLVMTRYSKLILCVFCPKPEICLFPKKPWFLLVGNSILIPQPGIRHIIITVQPLFQGLLSKQSYKTRVTYMQVKINHEFIFILLIKSRITEILFNPLYLMFTSPSSTQRISILENTGNERSGIVHKYSFVLSSNRQMPVSEEQYQHYHQNYNYCKHLSCFFHRFHFQVTSHQEMHANNVMQGHQEQFSVWPYHLLNAYLL